jgi:hypothetical protein
MLLANNNKRQNKPQALENKHSILDLEDSEISLAQLVGFDGWVLALNTLSGNSPNYSVTR